MPVQLQKAMRQIIRWSVDGCFKCIWEITVKFWFHKLLLGPETIVSPCYTSLYLILASTIFVVSVFLSMFKQYYVLDGAPSLLS